ncbi:MAG: hypothetical protein C0501_14615 [Isosphaera sp.]|nr:hypothetical protein [Isosphaera sp.]
MLDGMGRRSEFYTTVGDGPRAVSVGYSSTERDGYLGVRFVGPDGTRLERMTRCRKRDANYHVEAARHIARAYSDAYPASGGVGWDDSLARVARGAADLRPATLKAFGKVARVLRATLPCPASPALVTPELAARFAGAFLAGTYRRGKAAGAKEYPRSPATLASHVRNLSALWNHLVSLGLAAENPWKGVRRPQVERRRKPAPADGEVEHFFGWLRDRYPGWERLHALVALKALSGCRTLDLVQLRSAQLRDGRVAWDASQTKQREGRAVLLPPDLYAALARLAGPTHLWEGFVRDLPVYRPGTKGTPAAFKPETVYWVIGNVFREYAEAHPDRPRLTPHALRRRAITLTTMATGSVDAAAQAIGLHPATARGYYLDARKAFDADEVFRKTAAALIPAHTIPTLSGHTGEQSGTPVNTRHGENT